MLILTLPKLGQDLFVVSFQLKRFSALFFKEGQELVLRIWLEIHRYKSIRNKIKLRVMAIDKSLEFIPLQMYIFP